MWLKTIREKIISTTVIWCYQAVQRFNINHFQAVTGRYFGYYGKFMLACTLHKISYHPKRYKYIKRNTSLYPRGTYRLHTYIWRHTKMKLLQLPLINMKTSCKYPGLSLYLFSHAATCWILHICLAWKMRTDSHIPSCCSVSMHLLGRELSVWTHLLNQSSPPTCIERISFSVIHLC